MLFLLAVSVGYGSSGAGVAVSGSETLASGRRASVWSISCALPGDCAAGGSYRRGRKSEAFVVSETHGRWREAIEVRGIVRLNSGGGARVESISCGAAGDCAAVGYYTEHDGNFQAFVVGETNGRWGRANKVPGVGDLGSVSCVAGGTCTAGGQGALDGYAADQAVVVRETNGRWGNAIEVPGMPALNTDNGANVLSISCTAAGDCVAGGFYTDASLGEQAFVASEANGSWSNAIEVPGTATLNTGGLAEVDSISCAAPGECAAGGSYELENVNLGFRTFVVNETNGSWGKAITLRRTADGAEPDAMGSISCPAAGECTAAGGIAGWAPGFVVKETNDRWGHPIEVPGLAALNAGGAAEVDSISCAAVRDCAAGGTYTDGRGAGRQQVFVASETHGRWGKAIEVPGTARLNSQYSAATISISCPAAGDCAAGGYVHGLRGRPHAFVVSETNGSWAKAIQVFPAQ